MRRGPLSMTPTAEDSFSHCLCDPVSHLPWYINYAPMTALSLNLFVWGIHCNAIKIRQYIENVFRVCVVRCKH